MHVASNSKNRSIHIVTVVSLCIAIYLLYLFAVDPTFYTDTLQLFQQIIVALLIGFVAFIGIFGFNWARERAGKRWLKTIGPLDLFKICNDVAADMQSEIFALASFEKNSDQVDESLVIGAKPECFAFSFGLVVIGMSRYDPDFLQSYGFIQFHSRVLNRLVNTAARKYSAMNVDLELVESQLSKTKTRELQKILQAVDFYRKKSALDNSDPLKQLVKHISKQSALQNADQLRQLNKITDQKLAKVDALIQNYRK